MSRTLLLFLVVVVVTLLVTPHDASVLAADAPARSSMVSTIQDYKLGVGDKVRVSVFGEDELGGEFAVDGTGYVRLPLIGQIKTIGLSAQTLEMEVMTLLKDGFLKVPRVNVEVTVYRPFYILGEVARPGQYPYVNGMTVLNAIALAGGYTDRARTTDVDILRNGRPMPERLPVDQTVQVLPDDVLTVRQRYF